MAESSSQHRPFDLPGPRSRQASVSSSDHSITTTDNKSTSSHPRQPRASPNLGAHRSSAGLTGEQPRRRASKQSSLGARDRSSRGSSTTMTGPSDPAGDVTYTPTTHRISKAKKGKKVHVCEHPGCGKVFTRAEHRKRHEANHNPEPKYQCHFADCRKPFQRADLLARHMEKQHEMSVGVPRTSRSQRSTSETSSNPAAGGGIPRALGQPQPVGTQGMPQGSGAMSITSIIEHPMGRDLSYPTHSMSELAHPAVVPTPLGYRPEWAYGSMHSGDSPMYSSDSCSSPMSEYPNPQISFQSFPSQEAIQRPASTFSDASYHQGSITSPLSAGPSFSPAWATYEPMPTYEGAYVPTVGSSQQLPSNDLARQQQHAIRNESTYPAGLAMGQVSHLRVHDPRTKHYLDCYWQHFHPLFPIVHVPSFLSTVPDPLLAASMVVVGAQFSPRPDAKQYSATLYATCLTMMSDRAFATSRSAISDLQIVIHLEAFNRFRNRVSKVEGLHGSRWFNSLWTSLVADQDWLRTSHASLEYLFSIAAADDLWTAHAGWVDHESRRRIYVAAFVMDTQYSHLLQQPTSYPDAIEEDDLDLPFPTSAEIWQCVDMPTWRNLIMTQEAFSLSGLGQDLPLLDPFQSSLLTCYQIYRSSTTQSVQDELAYYPVKSQILPTRKTYHALCLSTFTPLHALLITASESWLFGTKITEEPGWLESKGAVRKWVSSDACKKAVWHATALLRLNSEDQINQEQQQDEQAGYLHDLWCLYIAALVCWAFGYGTANVPSQPRSLSDNAEMLAVEYLNVTNIGSWQDVERIPATARANTRGLLEYVRGRIGELGMGGLLNGAEDVLFRLVQGEGEMVAF
ncbi:hypothetical protein Q9189_000616 [Teloschistes chrysophthalmus]